VEGLADALAAVGRLIDGIRVDQWSAPTPCTDWTVRDLVTHLVGLNRVLAALLNDQALPVRGTNPLGDDPVAAYRDSGAAVRAAFGRPGVLDRTYQGPLGTSTGADRLHWRITDLLAHAWDLSRATGQPAELPEGLAERALDFAERELPKQSRDGRFGPVQAVADGAPGIDRLVAFLGRPVRTDG
jgi:uncharacterized protein (TIGR03086 family)